MEFKLSAFADEADTSLKGQIEALKKNNISCIELRGIDGINISSITAREARKFKKMLDDGNIAVWALGSPLGKVDINVNFANYLDTVKHTIELAHIFGTSNIRMFSFFMKPEDCASYRSKVMDYLNKMVEVSDDVNMVHENEKGIYGYSADNCCDIVKSVKGIKSIFDPANYIQCNENVTYAMDKLAASSHYFHIKDALYDTGEVVPSGLGDGNIKNLLIRATHDMVLTIEPHLKVFEGYSMIDERILKNKYEYSSSKDAFDAAVIALKAQLQELKFIEKPLGVWEKI